MYANLTEFYSVFCILSLDIAGKNKFRLKPISAQFNKRSINATPIN